jgi:hypothetical protein
MKKMKTKTIAFLVIAAVVVSAAAMGAVMAAKKDTCTTIQDGTLSGSDGELLVLGYNQWGYNYQAHMFNGMWCDYHPYYRPGGAGHEWCVENMADVELMMKWNDAWLSNKDCGTQVEQAEYTDLDTPDGKLDRHYPYDSYIGSGAWLTNHEFGTYVNDTGENCSYTYFCKIVAAPADAYVAAPYDEKGQGTWYTIDETEIGPVIWGAFAIIQEVVNDPCEGLHGLQYRSPASPGLGHYNP